MIVQYMYHIIYLNRKQVNKKATWHYHHTAQTMTVAIIKTKNIVKKLGLRLYGENSSKIDILEREEVIDVP